MKRPGGSKLDVKDMATNMIELYREGKLGRAAHWLEKLEKRAGYASLEQVGTEGCRENLAATVHYDMFIGTSVIFIRFET